MHDTLLATTSEGEVTVRLHPRDLDIHQGGILLAAMVVAVKQVALEVGSRDLGFEGQRVIADEKFHLAAPELDDLATNSAAL